jgi:hypothetical protein
MQNRRTFYLIVRARARFCEIAAQWRASQGVYDSERSLDRERGEDSILPDETALIPLAYTYEYL